jgi:hypothetical protein
MDKIKEIWAQYKLPIITVIAVMLVIAGFLLFKHNERCPEITTVPGTSASQLRVSDPKLSPGDARDISHRIDTVTRTQPPTVQYFTVSQAAADSKAQEIAKADGADKVIKTAKEVPVEGSDKPVIQNDYYAITMNRKHDIKVGAAVIDSKAYASVSYRNRDVEYTAYYNPATQQGGAGISVTVAKW